MTKHEDPEAPETGLTHSPETLLERYGADLDKTTFTDTQKEEFLLAYWTFLVAVVDFGFSVKAGDSFTPECDHGIDDVLEYLHLRETAPETVAPKNPNNNKETT